MLNFIIKMKLCDNAQHYGIRVLHFVKTFLYFYANKAT